MRKFFNWIILEVVAWCKTILSGRTSLFLFTTTAALELSFLSFLGFFFRKNPRAVKFEKIVFFGSSFSEFFRRREV